MSDSAIPIKNDFESLISDIRSSVLDLDDAMLDYFDIYAQEARFARHIFDADLCKLRPGAAVLEVGAGMMLLSCQLVREGFDVTALEPFGEGFSHFATLQKLIKDYAAENDIEPLYLECGAEDLTARNKFDYALSSNVMEHVGDVGEALERVYLSLKPNGEYRFICPNYAFPYEPHFNMPTLGSKKLTERLMWKRIKNDTRLPDPVGTWKSLNWITPKMIKNICRDKMKPGIRFDSSIFSKYLERALNDPLFQKRRGKYLSGFLRLLGSLGAFKLVGIVPVQLLPVIDCTVIKK